MPTPQEAKLEICRCEKGKSKPHIHVHFERPQNRGKSDYLFYSKFGINAAFGFCVSRETLLKEHYESLLNQALVSAELPSDVTIADQANFSLMVIQNGNALEAMDLAARVAGDKSYLIEP